MTMAKTDPLSAAARRSIAEQLGELLPPPGEERLAAKAPPRRPQLAESLAVCLLTAEQVKNPPADLSTLVKPSGAWHHQVHTADGPTDMARSQEDGFAGGGLQIQQWLRSPIAENIDKTIAWLDRKLARDKATVRLLVIPAYYVHALLIIRGKKYSAVVADQPPGCTELQREKEYPLSEFLQRLSRERVSGTLLPRGTPSAIPTARATLMDSGAARETMSLADLEPMMRQVTPTVPDLERKLKEALTGPRLKETLAAIPSKKERDAVKALSAAGGTPMLHSAIEGTGDFGSLAWRLYKRLFSVTWDKQGEFQGRYNLEPVGPRDYIFRPNADDPFRFIRSDGQEIQPGPMHTDGGSIPRVAWVIPDLDPWAYLPAYLLHDWEFIVHHCRVDQSLEFDDVNQILAEGTYTMMVTGKVPADWRKVEIVYEAVSSFVGKTVWDRPWTPDQCQTTMNPPA
jgi:hypothetical protein